MNLRMGGLVLLTGAGTALPGGGERSLFIGSSAFTPVGTSFCNKYHCRYLGWYTGENMFFTYTVRGYRLNTGDLFEVAWVTGENRTYVYNLRLTAKAKAQQLLADFTQLSTNRKQTFNLGPNCTDLKYPVEDARNYVTPTPTPGLLNFASLPIADTGYSMEFNCGRYGDGYRLVARGGGSDTYWFDPPRFKAGQP